MLHGKKIAALCTSRINDVQVNRFVNELNTTLVRAGFALLVYNINMDVYWEENFYPSEAAVYSLVDYDTTDVVIVMSEKIKSNTITGEIIAKAKAKGIPVIVVDGEHEDAVCIGFDYELGFEKIVRHVVEYHQVKHPHFMAGNKGNFFSEQRLEVFKRVIAENNIPFDDSMVSYGDFWVTPAIKAAKAIAKLDPLPDAVICANDIMALNTCDVFAGLGIKVPEQVIVTGFDGADEIYSFSPKISSVSCDIVVLADAVCDTAVKLVNGEDVGSHIYVEPIMNPNESCGCEEYIDPMMQLSSFNNGFYRYQDDLKVMFEAAGHIQMSDSIEEAAEKLNSDAFPLHDHVLNDVCCVINKSCLNSESNYFSDSVSGEYEPEMFVFYDAYSRKGGVFVPRGETSPPLRKMFEMKCPLIYSALTFMDKPIGYVCCSIPEYNIIDYSKIFQITTSMGVGIGGHITTSHQRYLYKKVDELYKTDNLTGLYNRHGFQTEFTRCKQNASLVGKPVAIIAADLDGLKYINDTFGHDAGDNAICSAGNVLRQASPKHSLCVRNGGDEMLVVVPDCAEPQAILQNIEKCFEEFNATSGLEYTVHASCGCFMTELTADFDLDAALKLADSDMYINKKERKRRNAT